MPDQPFGLSTLGQVLVPVSDVERATAFYRDSDSYKEQLPDPVV